MLVSQLYDFSNDNQAQLWGLQSCVCRVDVKLERVVAGRLSVERFIVCIPRLEITFHTKSG